VTERHRSLLIRGRFSDDEILDIVAVVQRIEHARPDDKFEVAIDDPAGTKEFFLELDKRPLPEGYGRVTAFIPLHQGGDDG
jgi:hypothetical protein